MSQPSKRRLGRGLAALIGEGASEESIVQDARHLRHVPVEMIHTSRHNPRKSFSEEELEELARSIADKGLLQPLVVRPHPNPGEYEIVAGERRWRAAQKAGVHDVPVLIRELSDGEALEVALIENIQRSDLNPLEEAKGYGQLIKEYGYTQQQLAEAIGKSRSHIANTLRLLNLPEPVQDKIEKGDLSAGHARTLITSESPDDVAQKIIDLGLSVREAEKLAKSSTPPPAPKSPSPNQQPGRKSNDVIAFEKALEEATGLKWEIQTVTADRGRLILHYQSLDQLDALCQRLVES